MNEQPCRDLQRSIVTGWIVLAVLLMATMISTLMQGAINTDFSEFVYHPGTAGFSVLCSLLSTYALMAVVTDRCSGRWLRWLNMILLAGASLYTLGHQISHVISGQSHVQASELLYLLHHVIGLWMTLLAIRWIRRAGREEQPHA